MKLTDRQENLLAEIIHQHVISAEPVGSKPLVEAGRFELSSATLRNEMSVLEQEGLLRQPHTSAGRVPTPAGYRYYLQNILESKSVSGRDQVKIKEIISKNEASDWQTRMKDLARAVADMIDSAFIICWSERDIYYTGIANVLQQPEFYRPEVSVNIARIIDHLDRALPPLYQRVEQTKVLIGDENPLGHDLAAIFTKAEGRRQPLIGIFGPLRMNYVRNLGIINYLKKEVSNV
ncbi:MAG: hypothetical protein NUV82_00525 [Candidatus Komeilibacteria bacterium]|nr:hypothetical protein [Candidatus Komeilibacteria bacterium]